jgi:phage-related protein
MGLDSRRIKPLVWMGSSKADLLDLPPDVVHKFGYALYLAQTGRRHASTKTLKGQGDAGVLEVTHAGGGNAYRAIHTARFAEAIFVLHVFQKKSKSGRATPRTDLALVERRLREAARIAMEMHA